MKKKKWKKVLKQFGGLAKTIIFGIILYHTYEVSNSFVDFILMLEPVVLKRVINIILVALVMLGYNIKIDDPEKDKKN